MAAVAGVDNNSGHYHGQLQAVLPGQYPMFETKMEQHWGRAMRCYAERPTTMDLMFRQAAARTPDAEALVEGPVRLNYGELDVRVDRVAAGLMTRGIHADDRVAMMLHNRIEVVVAVLAIARIGAILLPIDVRLRRPEIANIFADATPVAIIHEASLATELPEEGPPPDMRFAVGDGGHAPRFGDLLDHEMSVPRLPDRDEEAPYAIIYTSGTTGRPKGAVLTNLGMVHTALHWIDWLEMKPGERAILSVPWSHVAGLCGMIAPMLHLSGSLAIMAQFERRAFLRLASDHSMTCVLMMPAMFDICMLEPDLSRYDLSNWRLGIIGGAPTTVATMRRCAAALPQLELCRGYGATETTCPATVVPKGKSLAHIDSVGTILACCEIRIMNEDGNEVPVGENGELWIGGAIVSPGYWRAEAANAASFSDGFWKSGDIGSIDAEGYVRIVDRKKDMISRSGYKVYPAEVENVLCEMPPVIEAAVVGRPDMLGESVIAFVTARQPRSREEEDALTEAKLREYCSSRLADFKVPLRIVIGFDALPRNPTGKVQKDRLRARAVELRAR
jgi:long-chain acyl-CoA synthetase